MLHHPLKVAAALLLACTGVSYAQAPSVDEAKQALDRRLQKLKPDGTSERNILFGDVRAGKGDGRLYPFKVSLVIRDYEPGYPRNRYYGKTCVSQIDQEVYTLERDNFNEWNAQGRMTPDFKEKRCENNPSAGVSSIPLASLSGSPAPTGPIAPPRPSAAQGGGSTAAVPAGAAVPGSYECWANGQANMTLNFTIQGANRYTGTNGQAGTYAIDAASKRITFRGGSLDGVFPSGFYAIYYAPQGRPTVSIRNSGGSEAAFCQRR